MAATRHLSRSGNDFAAAARPNILDTWRVHRTPLPKPTFLADVICPDEATLTPDFARSILTMKFSPRAIDRMNELAEKNRQDTLSDVERAEMEKYLRVGNFLNLMKSKARRSIADNPSTP